MSHSVAQQTSARVIELAQYRTPQLATLPLSPTQNRHRRLGKIWRCPFCKFPSATERGHRLHRRTHQTGALADRNWEIFYAYREEGASVAWLAEQFRLSHATIYSVIQRGIAYPGIYDLEEAFR